LSYLKREPNDFIGALFFFKDQTKFWVYSYASFLFNQIISQKNADLPKKIPLLLSYHPEDVAIYKFWLENDKIHDFKNNIRPFRFIKLERRFVKARIFPQNVLVKAMPEGVALSFALEKGVYATTFLANFFEIKEGLPLPEWVKTDEYDTKKLLGLGSLKAVKEIFKENISSRVVLF
jgi:tRNA(Glu) U13 pseudouridine synthase TruD